MRRVLLYFQQMLCKHEWLVSEADYIREKDGSVIKQTVKVYMRCKKCGYHQKHFKY